MRKTLFATVVLLGSLGALASCSEGGSPTDPGSAVAPAPVQVTLNQKQTILTEDGRDTGVDVTLLTLAPPPGAKIQLNTICEGNTCFRVCARADLREKAFRKAFPERTTSGGLNIPSAFAGTDGKPWGPRTPEGTMGDNISFSRLHVNDPKTEERCYPSEGMFWQFKNIPQKLVFWLAKGPNDERVYETRLGETSFDLNYHQ